MNFMYQEKCVIVEIGGGLGNQLFGYATGLATSYHLNLPLYLDISSLEHDGFGRSYQLSNFKIDEKVSKLSRKTYIDKICRKIKLKNYNCVNNISELYELSSKKNIYIYNNVNNQSFIYFDFLRPILKEKLQYKCSHSLEYLKIKSMIEKHRICAVHMRFGDYKKYGYCIDPQYYLDAISKYAHIGKANCKILVFTDDYDEAKKIFNKIASKLPVNYINELGKLNDIDEFCLMRECHDFIISNSTFSWWGAYLGEKKDSVIFAPIINDWIENCWNDNFFPSQWIKIESKLKRNI